MAAASGTELRAFSHLRSWSSPMESGRWEEPPVAWPSLTGRHLVTHLKPPEKISGQGMVAHDCNFTLGGQSSES